MQWRDCALVGRSAMRLTAQRAFRDYASATRIPPDPSKYYSSFVLYIHFVLDYYYYFGFKFIICMLLCPGS